MYLGGQTCGDTYESCIDPRKQLETHVILAIIIPVVGISFALAFRLCVYYCCPTRRRKQARIHVARQMLDITTQNQAQHIYSINSGSSIVAKIPIRDTPPPTYEQVVPKTIGN